MFEHWPLISSFEIKHFVTKKLKIWLECLNIAYLKFLRYCRHFEANQAKSMSQLFEDCRQLTSLNLTNYIISNVQDMSHMLQDSTALTSLDVSKFDASNIIDTSLCWLEYQKYGY